MSVCLCFHFSLMTQQRNDGLNEVTPVRSRDRELVVPYFHIVILFFLAFFLISSLGAIDTGWTHANIFPIVTTHKRSCRKVMFLHLSVSHSVHRGECLSQHAIGGVHPLSKQPPRQTLPWADTPRQTPPWA